MRKRMRMVKPKVLSWTRRRRTGYASSPSSPSPSSSPPSPASSPVSQSPPSPTPPPPQVKEAVLGILKEYLRTENKEEVQHITAEHCSHVDINIDTFDNMIRTNC
jgi:hypothetical protein